MIPTLSGMNTVDSLVVDTGAFIKGVSFESWSKRVITVKEVLSEIKDTNTRQRLKTLPYEIAFREPSQHSLKHVSEFSKKTGDYHSLSPVDLKVIALTYQLQRETGPEDGANLNADPVKPKDEKKVIRSSQICPNGEVESGKLTRVEPQTGEEDKINSEDKENTNMTRLGNGITCDPNGNVIEKETAAAAAGLQTDQTDSSLEEGNKEEDDDSSADKSSSSESEGTDEDGWITPENIQQVCKDMGGALEEVPENVAVGCLTTDYAMQNVLIQMGLKVISVDGMLIKRLQTYALQCKACFKTCFKFGKVFCPFCGNRSLIKVLVETRSDGSVQYSPLSAKQFSHKGLRYSLPLPKGGRQPNIPIITPNQRNTFRLPRSREKVDPLDPDYVTRCSPFRSKDVTSRGVQIAFKHGGHSGRKTQEGWRKNPNQVKKKNKK